MSTPQPVPQSTASWRGRALRAITWLLAAACFYLVFGRIAGVAAQRGETTVEYLVGFFRDADWLLWLAIMVPYSLFFFLVDAHVTWRVVRWFNAPSLTLVHVLPIRASAYILSLVNEQVGKGAMTLYLWRRHQVPAWQALSSMIMLGMMEIYQLLFFAAVGGIWHWDMIVQASSQLPLTSIFSTVWIIAACYLPLHILYFRGRLLPSLKWRELAIFSTFRAARPVHYLLVLLFKAPTLIGAIFVYTAALQLFNVPVSLAQVLALLPVIFLAAALPLPFHAGALLLWTVLFPDYPEVGVFSMLMHTFFVLFNAVIGVAFLPRANRELFESPAPPVGAASS